MGTFSFTAYNKDIDPRLVAWGQAAAAASPYNVILTSGKRPGDPRFHGRGMAADFELVDPKTGKVLSNYQTPESFSAYQGFANLMRAAQMQMNPEAAKSLRWGGYFSGGKGKYGALDLMHFDLGGDTVGMGGGGWEQGLTPQQAALWNLQPGGGGSGVSTPVADALAPATNFNMPEKSPFDFSGLAAAGVQGLQRHGGDSQVIPDSGGPAMSPLPETPPETPGGVQGVQGAPGKNPIPDMDLANIFQVNPRIGQAGLDAPMRRF